MKSKETANWIGLSPAPDVNWTPLWQRSTNKVILPGPIRDLFDRRTAKSEPKGVLLPPPDAEEG